MRVGIDCRKIADFGIGTYARGLLQGLASLDDGGEEYVAFVPASFVDLVPSSIEAVAVDVPNYSVRELPVMGRVIAKARLDVFHSAHYVLPWTSCPSIATLHDVIQFHFPPRNPVASFYLQVMFSRAIQKSAFVITVTEAAKRSILETFDAAPEKIVVTPNGIDDAFFRAGEAATDLGRYFLFVGNDKPHKNVPRLLEAFQQVRRRDENLRLVMVGAAFERFAGVPGVTATGFVSLDRLAEIYRGAIALVMPSLEEGFGLPVAEAMACGAPVIASDIAPLREVAGGAALHADARSVAALANAMEEVLADATLRQELAERGRKRAHAFTWKRCAELTRDVYRRLAPRQERAGRML